MTKRIPLFVWVGFILCVLLIFSDTKGCSVIGGKATAAVYVYEKKSGGVPPPVGSAIGKLNERPGFIATTHEDDPTKALPAQYKNSVPAAREVGLPAFVTSAGDRVLKTVPNPTTEAQVLEAVP